MRTKYFSSNAGIRSQHGAAVVELAIVMIAMMLIVAGAIGLGRVFWYADALTKATRDGARLMTTWPVASIGSVGVGAAQTLARNTANAANVSPQLTTGSVQVECLNAAFGVVGCADGTTPVNVRVSIAGFNVAIGAWFPFVDTAGLIDYAPIGLTPHTTMRYMN